MTTYRTRSALNHATVVLGLALTLFAGRADADAVPQPPTDCAAGSQGNSCHGGTYCSPPTTCTTSAECSGGEVCQPTALCIGQVLCYGGIFTPDGGPTDFPEQSVEGLCTAGACSPDGGATCTTLSVCVSPGSGGSSGSSSSGGDVVIQNGCSCEAVGGSRGPIAIAALAVALGLGLTSRRRRVR
jgi:MYXO-CTERM domain-containing protein